MMRMENRESQRALCFQNFTSAFIWMIIDGFMGFFIMRIFTE